MSRSSFAFSAILLGSCLVWAAATATTARIVVIGDSTVSTYKDNQYPWSGWGQELVHYFQVGSVTVINHAVGGRSSRSFVELGQWASTVADLQKGDWLFIQFGHNDRDTKPERYTDTTDYKKYLGMYIDSARKLGVHPVLVTPMNMNTWNGTAVREVFTEGASNYWAAMKHVGTAKHVPVLDLGRKSTLLMDTLGQSYMAKFHFMGLDTEEYPNYPVGSADGTHFQEEGSQENARMITEEIARQASDSILAPLASILAKRYASNVATNLVGGGTITRSRIFPPGATATIKVKVAAGKKFRYWANAKGDSITAATRYTYVQDSLDHRFTAIFAGGASGVSGPSSTPSGNARILSVLSTNGSLEVSWSGSGSGYALHVHQADGRIVATRNLDAGNRSEFISLDRAATGLRIVELWNSGRIVDSKTIVR